MGNLWFKFCVKDISLKLWVNAAIQNTLIVRTAGLEQSIITMGLELGKVTAHVYVAMFRILPVFELQLLGYWSCKKQEFLYYWEKAICLSTNLYHLPLSQKLNFWRVCDWPMQALFATLVTQHEALMTLDAGTPMCYQLLSANLLILSSLTPILHYSHE